MAPSEGDAGTPSGREPATPSEGDAGTPSGRGPATPSEGDAAAPSGREPAASSSESGGDASPGKATGTGPATSDTPPDATAPKTPGSAKTSRTGRNLPLAIGVGVALGAMVLASLYYVKELFLVVMMLFLLQGLRELAEAFSARSIRIPLPPLHAGMVAAPLAAYVWGPEALVAAVALAILASLVWRMAEGPAEGYVPDATAAVFAAGYLVLMGGIVALLIAPGDGDHRIVIFIAVTIASDIGGYFAGTFFGRHKLAPTISPKKTWEGVTGSALACMLVGAWLVWWLLDGGAVWHGVVIGAAAVVTATAGDLIVSMLKRDLGIKDMGSLLPGHGGVMDRLDSLVATAPVVWLLLEVFVPSSQ
ncbi:phosphatidate cytidylyltransferase [Actinomadura sp. NBRC 104412]|uniref:phosphatidate cytidylyltransferase n=1 Tax=Actinomadura sp. NBRC 104412 TaxID=3032203 RepID=UPI00332A3A4A